MKRLLPIPLILLSCTTAHPRTRIDMTSAGNCSTPPNAEWDGFMCCEQGVRTGWVNVTLDASTTESAKLHEAKHVKQSSKFNTCADWGVWYTAHRLESEAEAFCASLAVDTMPPLYWNRPIARKQYAKWLAANYGDFTADSALKVVRRFC